LVAAEAAEAAQQMTSHALVRGGHGIGDCDVPGSAATIAPWNKITLKDAI